MGLPVVLGTPGLLTGPELAPEHEGPLAAVGPPSCTTRWSGQWGHASGHTQVFHDLRSPTQSCEVRGEERPLDRSLAQTSN